MFSTAYFSPSYFARGFFPESGLINLATGGLATTPADNAANGQGVAQAFDGSAATKWLTFASTGYLQYQFAAGAAYVVTQYALTAGADTSTYPGRAPKAWAFLGSNDGASWATLDAQSNQADTVGGDTRTYPVAAPAPYKYYRLNITASNGDGILQLAELALLGPAGQSQAGLINLATGGLATTPADNAANGQGVAQAFDGSAATKWLTFASTGYLQYQFAAGAAYVVTQYALTAGADTSTYPGRAPKAWAFLGSNDGASWATLDAQSNQADTVGGDTRTYPVAAPAPYKYYRLNITASNGDGILQLAELALLGPAGQSQAGLINLATGGLATTPADNAANGQGVAQAFDGSAATKWLTFASTGYLQYQFAAGAAYVVTQYALTAGADTSTYPGRAPKAWAFLGSNDGASWATLDAQSNQADTVGGDTRTYPVAAPAPYKYYRLNITASNGDGILQLAELALLGPAGQSQAA